MALFKYIGFDKDWWREPALAGTLYFLSTAELQRGNDRAEYTHCWWTTSHFFRRYGYDLKDQYQDFFNKIGILCLAKSLNQPCWNAYCSSGGVCLEFEFDSEIPRQNEIMNGHVTYDDHKEHNVPKYFMRNASDRIVTNVLKKFWPLSRPELFLMKNWVDSAESSRIGVDHITKELTFKKRNQYLFEDEFRFAHLRQPFGAPLRIQMHNSRMSTRDLGLTLARIHTSDVRRVAREIPAWSARVVNFP